MGATRRVEVDPERIVRWVNGFHDRHGVTRWAFEAAGTLVLTAADAAMARLDPTRLAEREPTAGPCSVPSAGSGPLVLPATELLSWAQPPATLGLVLIRRGGYAVGFASGQSLVVHRCGTRYVQSRTAAGGWSQQRFARRRHNQAEALVGVVIAETLRLVAPQRPDAWVLGGDKSLVREVLSDRRLAVCSRLMVRELYDLPDPRLSVLQEGLRRGRAVRISLTDPR